MPEENNIDPNLIRELLKNGVIYGHRKSKTHPKMKPHIGANRNEVEVLKPESVMGSLEKAIIFLKEQVKNKKVVLVVATKPSSITAVKELVEKFNLPHVTTRWLGGTLTNFGVIKERIKYYKDLKKKKEQGELTKYTKKEQSDFNKELDKLTIKFGGIATLEQVPDALFIVDVEKHMTATNEATRMEIPIVAIIDNDDNPDLVDYPIIANDHAKSSITWVVNKIIEEVGKVPAQEDETPKEEKK